MQLLLTQPADDKAIWRHSNLQLHGRCRARGGRASGGQAKIVREADRVLNTVLQADSETDPFLSAT